MVPEINNSQFGLTLDSLKNRLEHFSAPITSDSTQPTPNAQQNNGVISAAKQDTVELSKSNFEVLAFAKTIKGANEFIGALQTANVALKKINKAISSGADENTISEIASKSSFMGNKIFDKNLVVSVGGNEFSLTLQNPASLNSQERLNYVSSKQADIIATLNDVNKTISSPTLPNNVSTNGNPYNFEEFDAQAFKKMF